MRKKSKFLLSTVGLITGVCVFATTAFATINNLSGYEQVKEALMQSTKMTNFTATGTFNVESGSDFKTSQSFVSETDGKNSYNSVIDENGDKTVESYYQDGYLINKIGKDSKLTGFKSDFEGMKSDRTMTETETKFVSVLVDTLVGDLKNYVVTENNEVYIELSENQIPSLAQLFVATISEEFKTNSNITFDESGSNLSLKQFEQVKTVLTLNNLSIKKVNKNIKIDGNKNIEKLDSLIVLGGNTDSGEYLETSVSIKVAITDINSTVVDKVNIDEVEIVSQEDYFNKVKDTMGVTENNGHGFTITTK